MNTPTARLLDLTRLTSRVGRGALTGVDRVEMAYLHALLKEPIPLFGVVRLSGGFALFDQAGCNALLARMTGKVKWGRPDVESLVRIKQSQAQKVVQSDCRRLALKKSRALAKLLDKMPTDFSYMNVGHSNISKEVFFAIKEKGGFISVLVHDMIPLDYPEYQRPQTVGRFSAKMQVVSNLADLVIYNSHQSQSDGERYFDQMGRIPNGTVAHLGLTKSTPETGPLPSEIDTTRPFFVTVGTIEPRKNHRLLLDIWEESFSDSNSPQLVVIGARGWNNEDIFKRLDLKPKNVIELNRVSDRKLAQLTQLSAGLLFPSFAEGFGLPPAEAILHQTPVICGDLPVYREFLGNIPIYADSEDRYLWKVMIEKLADQKWAGKAVKFDLHALPTWRAHFNQVLKFA